MRYVVLLYVNAFAAVVSGWPNLRPEQSCCCDVSCCELTFHFMLVHAVLYRCLSRRVAYIMRSSKGDLYVAVTAAVSVCSLTCLRLFAAVCNM